MTKLSDQVREFMIRNDQLVRDTPGLPPKDVVKLRLTLIAEEFFELLRASSSDRDWTAVHHVVLDMLDAATVNVGLADLADALGDLDYVVEGTRAAFGIDGEPIADLIHAANMRKFGKDERGKVAKPLGFESPDVWSELERQGWKP